MSSQPSDPRLSFSTPTRGQPPSNSILNAAPQDAKRDAASHKPPQLSELSSFLSPNVREAAKLPQATPALTNSQLLLLAQQQQQQQQLLAMQESLFASYGGGGSASSKLLLSLPLKKRRKNFTKTATDVLKTWFFEHILHPYPDEAEKLSLAMQTNLTVHQVSYWFVNARKRIWQPLISAQRAASGALGRAGGSGMAAAMGGLSPESLAAEIEALIAAEVQKGMDPSMLMSARNLNLSALICGESHRAAAAQGHSYAASFDDCKPSDSSLSGAALLDATLLVGKLLQKNYNTGQSQTESCRTSDRKEGSHVPKGVQSILNDLLNKADGDDADDNEEEAPRESKRSKDASYGDYEDRH